MAALIPSTRQEGAPDRPIAGLLGFFGVCYTVAGVGALSTVPSIPNWYAALAKPSFNPPNWIFAPVWTALYGLMAIAAWLVWRTPKTGLRAASRLSGLNFFSLQLLLNAVWTPVFFHYHWLLAALVVILCLWVAILFTTIQFWKMERFAAVLLLPYLAWVGFAAALNYQIYRLN
ncbi:TspO/MBR family protein [Tunturiibacter lichenicola]|jgi:benzodiazapine receptor|uniref:TspO/MBR family protein n=1 Tax=Tunturiibacter lichenicola TaxID=2051959 RepID=UPI0021B32E72|nr:TspO/MBR family protein [Edaphobacter lichenicola]